MKRSLRIIISIAIILVIGICIYISYTSDKIKPISSGTVGNTAGNLYNNGLFCEYNGKIYFSNSYDNGALYSMNSDGTKLKKLGSSSVSFITAGGDYLVYFQKQASGKAGLGYARTLQGIYRSTLSGKHTSCLKSCLVFNLQLVDNYVYFLTSDKKGPSFIKLKIDKSEETLISESGINFASARSDGMVFYNGDTSNHYLYQYDTQTDSTSTLWEGNIWYPIYQDNYIYYLDVAKDYILCRYSLTENMVEILTHDRVDCYNLAGDYIYYQKNSANAPALKRMTLNGQNVENIMDGNYTNINVAGSYVYFTAFENEFPIYRIPINGSVAVTTFDEARDAALKYN